MWASKVMLIPMLLVFAAVAQDEKSITVQWSESEQMESSITGFVAAEGIDIESGEWHSSVVYADGSVDAREKHNDEAFWPITVKFTKISSLSESDIAKQHEEEAEQKRIEEEEAARLAAEASERIRKDEEAKAAAKEQKRIAEEQAARQKKEASLAAEKEETARRKEEEERQKAEQAAREAEEAAELARTARATELTLDDSAKAERLQKEADEKKKEQEAAEAELKKREEEHLAAEAEADRQKQEQIDAQTSLEEMAKANEVRNLKWRWATDIIPVTGWHVPKMGDTWNLPESRNALKEELNNRASEGSAHEIQSKQYKTRKVELADVDYPEQRRVFENFQKMLEWLAMEMNINPEQHNINPEQHKEEL